MMRRVNKMQPSQSNWNFHDFSPVPLSKPQLLKLTIIMKIEMYYLTRRQRCELIFPPVYRGSIVTYGGAFWTKMQSNRDLHSIGSYPGSIGSYFHSIRSYFHSTGSYLSSIRSYFNYFVASYMTLVYSSVVFHIYPYLRGHSIPSDRNYRSVSTR